MKAFSKLVYGALGGVSATGPMTVAMILLHRCLPPEERYPLPPHEITGKLIKKISGTSNHKATPLLTLINHFGYGTAAGAIYGVTTGRGHALPRGLIFGVLVWLVSYLGLLPGAGILRSAEEHPGKRNWLMLTVHLLWGVLLSTIVHVLMSDSEKATPALARNSPLPKHDAKP